MHEVLRTSGVSYGLLKDISFSLETARITVLLDFSEEEIADLVWVFSGMADNYQGKIRVDGNPVVLKSVADAQNAGIFCIGKSGILIPNLSIEENIGLIKPLDFSFLLDKKRSHEMAQYFLDRFGIHARPEQYPAELQDYELRELEMFKAITLGARVILLSRFFETYSVEDRARLVKRMKLLTELGISVLVLVSRPHPELIGEIDKVIMIQAGTTGLTKFGPEADAKMKLPELPYRPSVTVTKNAADSYVFESWNQNDRVLTAAPGEVTAVLDREHLIPQTEYEARRFLGQRGRLIINGTERISPETGSGRDREFSIAYYSYQNPRILKNLTVEENICLHAQRLLSKEGIVNSSLNRYLARHVLGLGSYFRELNEHIDDEDCSRLNDTAFRELEVARAVVCRPAVMMLLMDGLKDSIEKTGQLYQLCHMLAKDYGMAVITVFHEQNDIRNLAPDRMIRLH